MSKEPGVNEVSFRARPYHNVHSTLEVDTRATCPRWRVDSMEGGRVGREGEKNGHTKPLTKKSTNLHEFHKFHTTKVRFGQILILKIDAKILRKLFFENLGEYL
jgi:hypothetical protein